MSNIVRYTVQSDRYSHIPGQPIAYWVSNSFANLFKEKVISSYGDSRQGLITGDNERFLKMRKRIGIVLKLRGISKNIR